MIEELELNRVSWNFVSRLLKRVKFPNLKTIILNLEGSRLDLDKILVEFSLTSQLSSLTLSCNYHSRERGKEFSFVFPNLTFFRLSHFDGSFKLSHLLDCMPRLIEFQIDTAVFQNFAIESTTNIRFLSLPLVRSLSSANIFINLIKNTPNLIELSNNSILDDFPSSSDLTFYLKILKEYFEDELQFEIKYYCSPIHLLKTDSDLLKLIQIRSSEVADYLEETYRLSKYKGTFVKQLFMNEIKNIWIEK